VLSVDGEQSAATCGRCLVLAVVDPVTHLCFVPLLVFRPCQSLTLIRGFAL
jgi:hypothetical protein